MPSTLILFSHTLTVKQQADLRSLSPESEIIHLPTALQQCFSNIQPGADFPLESAELLCEWITTNGEENSYVLLQGDYGITVYLAVFCLFKKMIPIYSTTNRIAKENKSDDGSITLMHKFKHVEFRKYQIPLNLRTSSLTL